jgi:hypothetical protein
MMERCVIHDKDRLGLRPFPTVLQELLNKIFKNTGVGRPLEDLRENNPILGIGRQYLIPLALLELRDLNRCDSK